MYFQEIVKVKSELFILLELTNTSLTYTSLFTIVLKNHFLCNLIDRVEQLVKEETEIDTFLYSQFRTCINPILDTIHDQLYTRPYNIFQRMEAFEQWLQK